MNADIFITRWSGEGARERADFQSWLNQLCAVIAVSGPNDERIGDPDYAFERPVRFRHEDGKDTTGFIDCYRKGCFVMEAKQSRKRAAGGELYAQTQFALALGGDARASAALKRPDEDVMRRARRQAEGYAKALDEWPPFLVIVDVNGCIELWSDFARQGKGYAPYPDRLKHRIGFDQLRRPEIRDMLRAIWTAPMTLDPAAHTAAVTTEISAYLARITRSMEARAPRRSDGRLDPIEKSAWIRKSSQFLIQCVFAMFADSVGLIPDRGFQGLIRLYRGKAEDFHKAAGDFFQTMDRGGHSAAIQVDIRRFNGGLFSERSAVPITEDELNLLALAASRDWAAVEPAIFGALLEQALDPAERAELGAHYTPRPYVETLILATIIEPLRADWEGVEANAVGLALKGREREARSVVRQFHHDLCAIRVLDPACGTGNFLYVAMRAMQELESEVLTVLSDLGDGQYGLLLDRHTVSPEQFWGLEKNRRAVPIAEMVMWIGYLQWHFATFGKVMPSEPILKNYNRIQEVDALLTWDGEDLVRDDSGRPALGVGGQEQYRYVNVRVTAWPPVHFIVGNPPFIGGKDLRRELGDGYVEALWAARGGRFRSADLVMAWWDRAAELLTAQGSILRRFGFITTNSITQTFSRRVIEHHLSRRPPMHLTFATPDHPWIKGSGRADVRIAMTVAAAGEPDGQARQMSVEQETDLRSDSPRVRLRERRGVIGADLTIGPDITQARPLKANAGLCTPGMKLHGAGFIVDEATAQALIREDPQVRDLIRPYRNGRDLADKPRNVRVIDLFGLDEVDVRRCHPGLYQHVLERVKPERDTNNRAAYRENWWVFGEPRRELRPALEGLDRYIATVETAKHRWFTFLEGGVTPDNKIIVIASDDPFHLGVLSSSAHRLWFIANSAKIGGNDADSVYVKGACFDPFPFPEPTASQRALIAALAEELDDLRREVRLRHGFLTMTGLYNARARLALGGVLTDSERAVHQAGCVAVLDELHKRLDAAVLEAYGWPQDVAAASVVERLLSLNHSRALDEADGRIGWLRPQHQSARVPVAAPARQIQADLRLETARPTLPSAPDALASTLLATLRAQGRPITPAILVDGFAGARDRRSKMRVEQTLAVLAVTGSVRRTPEGWFAPRRESGSTAHG